MAHPRRAWEAASALQLCGLSNEVQTFSKEAWHEARARAFKGSTRSWKSGGVGIWWLPEGQADAVGDAVQK